jgi:hypothetical protein
MLARRTNLLPGSNVPAAAKSSLLPEQAYRDTIWFRMSKEERDAYVRREWKHARTIWEAADAVGCAANTIGLHARNLGLPVRGKGRKRRLA